MTKYTLCLKYSSYIMKYHKMIDINLILKTIVQNNVFPQYSSKLLLSITFSIYSFCKK